MSSIEVKTYRKKERKKKQPEMVKKHSWDLCGFADNGYPHDGRADKDPYPHDGRADKDPYPHDGRADKDPYPHDHRADKDSYQHDSNNQCIILRLQLSFAIINVQLMLV